MRCNQSHLCPWTRSRRTSSTSRYLPRRWIAVSSCHPPPDDQGQLLSPVWTKCFMSIIRALVSIMKLGGCAFVCLYWPFRWTVSLYLLLSATNLRLFSPRPRPPVIKFFRTSITFLSFEPNNGRLDHIELFPTSKGKDGRQLQGVKTICQWLKM